VIRAHSTRITRWISEPDEGEYDAFNKGIRMATGGVIKIMTDDDELLPGAIASAAQYFEEHPNVDILFGHSLMFDDRDKLPLLVEDTRQLDFREAFSVHNILCRRYPFPRTITMFLRRSLFERVGYLSTEFLCGDTEFVARTAKAGFELGICNSVFIYYHITHESSCVSKRWEIARDHWRVTVRHGTLRDILIVSWRWFVLPILLSPLQFISHRLGLHPIRWLASRRTTSKYGKGART